MSGLFLLTALCGIMLLIMWLINNDEAVRIEDQRGLFRMVVPKDAGALAAEPGADDKRPRAHGLHAPGLHAHGLQAQGLQARGHQPPTRPTAQHPLPPHNRAPGRPAAPRLPEQAKDAAEKHEAEEQEIVHPLWQGRPRHRP